MNKAPKESPEKRRAIGYCRVSTEEQATDGGSLDMQEAKILAYCEQADFELQGEVFEDAGISGKDLDHRPAAIEAIEAAIDCEGVLVVYSLSRLSRSLKDTFEIAERLQKGGAEIVSIKEKFDTTSPTGRMIFGILAVLNQFEREITRERTIDTLKRMKQNGERVGRHAPYGYRWSKSAGKNEADDCEQQVIRQIKMAAACGTSPAEIAARLNSLNVKFRDGGLFRARNIKRILNSQ